METVSPKPAVQKPPRGPLWIRLIIFAAIGAAFAYDGQWGVAVLAWGVGAVVLYIAREIGSRRTN